MSSKRKNVNWNESVDLQAIQALLEEIGTKQNWSEWKRVKPIFHKTACERRMTLPSAILTPAQDGGKYPLQTKYLSLRTKKKKMPVRAQALIEAKLDVLIRHTLMSMNAELHVVGPQARFIYKLLMYDTTKNGESSILCRYLKAISDIMVKARGEALQDGNRVEDSMEKFSNVVRDRIFVDIRGSGEWRKQVNSSLSSIATRYVNEVDEAERTEDDDRICGLLIQSQIVKNIFKLDVVEMVLKRLVWIVKKCFTNMQMMDSDEDLNNATASLPSLRNREEYNDFMEVPSITVAYYVSGYAIQRTKKYLSTENDEARQRFFDIVSTPTEFKTPLGMAMEKIVNDRDRFEGLTKTNQAFFFSFFLPLAKWLVKAIAVVHGLGVRFEARASLITNSLVNEENVMQEWLASAFDEALKSLQPQEANGEAVGAQKLTTKDTKIITRELRRRFVNAVLIDILRRQPQGVGGKQAVTNATKANSGSGNSTTKFPKSNKGQKRAKKDTNRSKRIC